MADGTFAVALFVLGLADMGFNHCGTAGGCLGPEPVTPRFAISGGEVQPRQARRASEIYLRYDLGRKYGPFGTAAGLSVGEHGEVWAGFGATLTYEIPTTPFYVELHAMPGLYLDNGGFDLGGPIEFRSGIEAGFENRMGWRFAVTYDHRSNADIYRRNPGIETVQLKVSIPLRK